jgi:hypothetical protein
LENGNLQQNLDLIQLSEIGLVLLKKHVYFSSMYDIPFDDDAYTILQKIAQEAESTLSSGEALDEELIRLAINGIDVQAEPIPKPPKMAKEQVKPNYSFLFMACATFATVLSLTAFTVAAIALVISLPLAVTIASAGVAIMSGVSAYGLFKKSDETIEPDSSSSADQTRKDS